MARRKPAKRWLAMTLAFVLSSGIGHFYAGFPRRGVCWLIAQILTFVLLALATIQMDGSVVPLFGMAILPWIGQAIDLALIERKRFAAPPSLPRAAWFAIFAVAATQGTRLATREYLLEAFQIPSASMAPTLLPGDRFVIDKTVHGQKSPPERGQVIVFEYPGTPAMDLVKRVVGLPNDEVEFKAGHPIINGWPVPSCLLGNLPMPTDNGMVDGELHLEFLGNDSYLTWYESDRTLAHEGPFTVMPGQAFVVGDNRWNSSDSRSWNEGRGAGLPLENIKGHALSVWLAFDPSDNIAWNRIGLALTGRSISTATEFAAERERCLAKRPTQTLPPR